MLNEFEIFQNQVIGAHAIWEFTKYYQQYHATRMPAPLVMVMPVLPLCFNKRVVHGISIRNYSSGSLLRSLEDYKDLFSGLQERMEDMAKVTLKSVYLGCVTNLIILNKIDSTITSKAKSLPHKLRESVQKNQDYNGIINTARRVGAWFGQLNESEVMLYFNLKF